MIGHPLHPQLLQEAYPHGSVTVAAKSFHNTTSHGAAGLWKPFKLGAHACDSGLCFTAGLQKARRRV